MTRLGSEPTLDLRLRVTSAGLLALPWLEPLAEWNATEAPLRDIPVGPSRHLVRFVETDDGLWALKGMPRRIAVKEYEALRALEERSLPAVRAAGLVIQPTDDNAILVTRYLERSWQYRRLFMRIPMEMRKHRERLLDAMAGLLVDLHRNGVFWGDCSLANTLFTRDGQVLQASLVDAETTEIHPILSDGQRRHDLEILVENVAGGLVDLAIRLDQPREVHDALFDEAASVATRYQSMWEVLHAEPTFPFKDRLQLESQIRRLHDLGFAVDEVSLESVGDGHATMRLKVAVAARHFHSEQLRTLTGLEFGEGQARVLLGDLRSHRARLMRESPQPVSEAAAARRWVDEVFVPGMERAHQAVGGVGDAVQVYCDFLEVRWLLSEQAGRDVGDAVALEALAHRSVPPESAARMAIVDDTSDPSLSADLLGDLGQDGPEATRG